MMTHTDTNFEFCSDLIDVPFFEDVQELIYFPKMVTSSVKLRFLKCTILKNKVGK